MPTAPSAPTAGAASSLLSRLTALTTAGRYAQALEVLHQSQDLSPSLPPGEAAALEALLRACDTCEEEARTHHDALGRAIAREQVLGACLRECTDMLVRSYRPDP